MANNYELRLNITEVNEAIKQAFQETALLYSAKNTEVISEVGAFSSHPDSDIVDNGILRSRQTLDFPGDTEANLSWPVEYAAYVHEGYVRRNGTVVIGRPWTELAAERLDINQTFSTLVDEALE